jgi:hypothetical protein
MKVQAFNASTCTLSVSQRNFDFEAIEKLFDPIECSMHIPITNLRSMAEAYDESPELLVSICTMAHLSRLFLHATMVPLLSGKHQNSTISQESVQRHTEMVVQQATAYVRLLKQFFALDLDITRLWPICGYGAFMVGNVFAVCYTLYRRHAFSTTFPDLFRRQLDVLHAQSGQRELRLKFLG